MQQQPKIIFHIDPLTEKYCSHCGEVISKQAEICPKCGVRQATPTYAQEFNTSANNTRIIAALLAIFLGWLGAHKFYLGKPVMGIIYFLFCWTGIPTIVGVIEGILYLLSSPEKFQEKYLTK